MQIFGFEILVKAGRPVSVGVSPKGARMAASLLDMLGIA